MRSGFTIYSLDLADAFLFINTLIFVLQPIVVLVQFNNRCCTCAHLRLSRSLNQVTISRSYHANRATKTQAAKGRLVMEFALRRRTFTMWERTAIALGCKYKQTA